MAPVLPVPLAIIHAEVLMRMMLCQVLEKGRTMQVVLQMDSLEHLRSMWPASGAKVVLLHYCGAITLLLDSIRWLKRLPAPPAVLKAARESVGAITAKREQTARRVAERLGIRIPLSK